MSAAEQSKKRPYRKTSETQEIVFKTAMELMSEKGFQGTTVREICAGAGIPVGTFYNCFHSKVDIFRRIYDDGDAFIQAAMEMPSEENGALDMLRLFVRRYAQLNEQTGIEVLRVLFYPSNAWFSMERPMQRYARRIVETGQKTGEIRCGISANEIVECLFDILRGISYNWCVCDGAFDLAERTEKQMELFCKAIGSE